MRRVETESWQRNENSEEKGELNPRKNPSYQGIENSYRGNHSVRGERREEYGGVEQLLRKMQRSSPERRMNKQLQKQQARNLSKQSERVCLKQPR